MNSTILNELTELGFTKKESNHYFSLQVGKIELLAEMELKPHKVFGERKMIETGKIVIRSTIKLSPSEFVFGVQSNVAVFDGYKQGMIPDFIQQVVDELAQVVKGACLNHKSWIAVVRDIKSTKLPTLKTQQQESAPVKPTSQSQLF